jgi:hypothetical protein
MTAVFQKATGIPVKLDGNSTSPLLTAPAAIAASAAADPAPGAGAPSLNRR